MLGRREILFTVLLLFFLSFPLLNGTKTKVPSSVQVEDEPGEDDCDYDNYLWLVLTHEVDSADDYTVYILSFLFVGLC